VSFLSTGVAVVTGAGSGIGRALAQQLAAAGSALALADIDEPGLKQTIESLGDRSAAVSTHVMDVAEEASVSAFAEDVRSRHGRVTLLINNAGVSLHGDFEGISLDDFRWLMNINFWGTVFGVKYFLPILKREKHAHIEPFERFWNYCSGGTMRLLGEQICGARIHGGAAPRTGGRQCGRFLRSSRRHSDADRAAVAHWRRHLRIQARKKY